MERIKVETLEKLGFTTVSNKVKEAQELKKKLEIAYEHFRFVTQEKIDNFNSKLIKETQKEDRYAVSYKCLKFLSLKEYEEVPPAEVLTKLEEAQKLGCFDTFEIAKIEDVVETKDPIVFGRVNGCSDRFFVAQWDDDVKIEQILNENEG